MMVFSLIIGINNLIKFLNYYLGCSVIKIVVRYFKEYV